MKKKSVILSKSKFISGWQCPKRLYYEIHRPELKDEPSAGARARMDMGNIVGEFARQLNNCEIEFNHTAPFPVLVSETEKFLENPKLACAAEASFCEDNVRIMVDVLKKVKKGLAAIEVKASTRIKDYHLWDLAVQVYVLKYAGYDVANAGLLLLNGDYIYDGKTLVLGELFKYHELLPEVENMQDEVKRKLGSLNKMLRRDTEPKIEPGVQCAVPFRCPFYEICNEPLPDFHISEIPRISRDKIVILEERNIETIFQVPNDFQLTAKQSRVVNCVKSGEEYVNKNLHENLSKLEFPLYCLDFEAITAAVPMYRGTKPFSVPTPFQYSVHVMKKDGTLTHKEFLWNNESDPRERLIKALLKDVKLKGNIVVYSGYEKMIINSLIKLFPKYAQGLEKLLDRLWDLNAFLNKHYYHPQFHGSYSIKSVLPAITGQVGYGGLEIQDGMQAVDEYWIMISETTSKKEKERIYKNLLEYCKLDTLAMVEVYKYLKALSV